MQCSRISNKGDAASHDADEGSGDEAGRDESGQKILRGQPQTQGLTPGHGPRVQCDLGNRRACFGIHLLDGIAAGGCRGGRLLRDLDDLPPDCQLGAEEGLLQEGGLLQLGDRDLPGLGTSDAHAKRERQQDGEGQEYDNSEAYSVELGNAESIGSFHNPISPFSLVSHLRIEDWIVVFTGVDFYYALPDRPRERLSLSFLRREGGGGGLWFVARRSASPVSSRRARCRPERVSWAAPEVPLLSRLLRLIPKGMPAHSVVQNN